MDVRDVAKGCLEAAGHGIKGNCYILFEWIGKITHTRPLYTRYSLYTISSNSHFTHDKATAELGYHPRDMQDAIRDTIS